MNLAARRSSRLREDFVMRLGCLLVSLAVLASLVLEPPKAKAFAVTSSAVTALAGGFLNACGLAPVVSGMSSSGEVNEAVARLIQEYLDAEVMGASVGDWLSSFGQAGLAVHEGKLILAKPLAENLMAFAQWVASKYGTKPGVNVVYSKDVNFHFIYNGLFAVWDYPNFVTFTVSNHSLHGAYSLFLPDVEPGNYVCFVPSSDVLETVQGGNYFYITNSFFNAFSPTSVEQVEGGKFAYYSISEADLQGYSFGLSVSLTWAGNSIDKVPVGSSFPISLDYGYISYADAVPESLSLDVAEQYQQILDRLTALEEGQSIALDVGATQSMEIQDILQGILDAILAGDLAASAEVVDEAVEPVEPDPPVVPVVPSGLDKLGAALTSRFPFSIPWDVYKSVSLLAAPPKAPYFEVDFLEPIGHLVGGWKGSTKIVLDMSEYEIIGQVCRWTSTIGFCLMLATGTKRLIWTA